MSAKIDKVIAEIDKTKAKISEYNYFPASHEGHGTDRQQEGNLFRGSGRGNRHCRASKECLNADWNNGPDLGH